MQQPAVEVIDIDHAFFILVVDHDLRIAISWVWKGFDFDFGFFNLVLSVEFYHPVIVSSLYGSFQLGVSSRGISCKYKSADRKSTRLNSSHVRISYAVFCLKKKNKKITYTYIH